MLSLESKLIFLAFGSLFRMADNQQLNLACFWAECIYTVWPTLWMPVPEFLLHHVFCFLIPLYVFC